MEILNSLNLGAANATDNLLLVNFREGMQAEGIRLRGRLPVSVGAAGTPVTADLINVMRYFLGSLNIAWGPKQEKIVYDNAPGDEVRTCYRVVNMDEVPNDFVGVAAQGALGAKTYTVDLFIPFRHPTLRGKQKRPGWTQMRTMKVTIQEGAALTAGALTLTRGAGNATWDVIPVYRPGSDNLASILSYRRINSPRLDAEGPDGLTLAAWDDNQAYSAAHPLLKYSLRLGKAQVYNNIDLAPLNDEWSRLIDAGGSNVVDTVTLLHFIDPWNSIEHAPHGKVSFVQASQYLASIHLRCLYWPAFDGETDREMTAYASSVKREPVVSTVTDVEPDADRGAAAVASREFVSPSDSRFTAREGLLGTPDGNVQLSIPQVRVAQVNALAKTETNPGVQKQVASLGQKQVSLRIPGAIDTSGKGQGGALGREGIRSVFRPLFQ